MASYFVISADGSRFGPADIDTLVKWTHEGRIIAETQLLERGSERQLRADSITAVAVALQRLAGSLQPVGVERGSASPGEFPTTTQAPRAMPPPPPPPQSFAPGIVPLQHEQITMSPKNKILAGLFGIFLGGFGIHRFYLGYRNLGLLMLLISIFGSRISHGRSFGVVGLWGLVEGIIILCGGIDDAQGRPLRA